MSVGLAGLMAALAAVICARFVLAQRVGRRCSWDVDLCHLLMAGVMAAMFLGVSLALSTFAWAAVFFLFGVWFMGRLALRSRSRGAVSATAHFGPHAALAGAMVCSLFFMRPMAVVTEVDLICGARMLGMAGGGTAGAAPIPALVLGALCFVLATLSVDRRHLSSDTPPTVLAHLSSTSLHNSSHCASDINASASQLCDSSPSEVSVAASKTRRRGSWLLHSRTTAGCHAAMAAAMGAMLVTLR